MDVDTQIINLQAQKWFLVKEKQYLLNVLKDIKVLLENNEENSKKLILEMVDAVTKGSKDVDR